MGVQGVRKGISPIGSVCIVILFQINLKWAVDLNMFHGQKRQCIVSDIRAWVMDNIMSKRPELLSVIEAVTTSHKCQIKTCRA